MKLSIKNAALIVPFLIAFPFFAALSQDKKKEIAVPADIDALLKKHTCFACHKVDARLVGPAYQEVAAKKYKDQEIVELIYNPKPANWPGYPPMTPMKHVPKEDALKLAKWINTLKATQKK